MASMNKSVEWFKKAATPLIPPPERQAHAAPAASDLDLHQI
jgi:hypothetical protein